MSSQTRKASEEFAWCLGTETHQMIDGKVPTSHTHAAKTQTNPRSLTALQHFFLFDQQCDRQKPRTSISSIDSTTDMPNNWQSSVQTLRHIPSAGISFFFSNISQDVQTQVYCLCELVDFQNQNS